MEFSLTEMIVIALVGLLLYGGKLPQVALAVGRALGELKRGLQETKDMVHDEVRTVKRAVDPGELGLPVEAATRVGEYDEPYPDGTTRADLATEDISVPDEPADAEPEEAPQDPAAPEPDAGTAETASAPDEAASDRAAS